MKLTLLISISVLVSFCGCWNSELSRAESAGPSNHPLQALKQSLRAAKASGTHLLVHGASPKCRNCDILRDLLEGSPDIFKPHFTLLQVDSTLLLADEDSKSLFGSFGGTPWIVILDQDGNKIADSIGPDGHNIGLPSTSEAVEHFLGMIDSTAPPAPGRSERIRELFKKHLVAPFQSQELSKQELTIRAENANACAIVAMAVTKYYQRNGAWPTSWDVLTDDISDCLTAVHEARSKIFDRSSKHDGLPDSINKQSIIGRSPDVSHFTPQKLRKMVVIDFDFDLNNVSDLGWHSFEGIKPTEPAFNVYRVELQQLMQCILDAR
jgi:hypothetical protein